MTSKGSCDFTSELTGGRGCRLTRAGGFADWGSLGFRLLPFPGSFVTPTPDYFTAFWSLRIFIQKQGLKKLYRVSAAENWAPAPRPLPPATGRALSLGCPLTSPASLFQSKGYR